MTAVTLDAGMVDAAMTGALQAVRDALGPGWALSSMCSLGAFGLNWALIATRIVSEGGAVRVDSYASGQYGVICSTFEAAVEALMDAVARGVTIEQMEGR